MIRHATRAVLNLDRKWNPPPEYLKKEVTGTVLRILLGFDR